MLDVGTGNKTWMDRGIGLVKILQHQQHDRCRVLMRQEKTMKLLINHLLLPGLVLVPHETNDRALVWRANDYSSGEEKETDFCLRFGGSEIADAFKVDFQKYQAEMEKLIAGEDSPGEDGGAAAEEVTELLEGLSTKESAASTSGE
jgi:Ran-binding protein 1